MKAMRVVEYGLVDKIELATIDRPVPAEGQVLIKIKSASVNPFDVTLASGAMASIMPLTLPYTIGGDFAGIVEGSGQEVYGTAIIASKGSGSMAEYGVANLANISDKPRSLSFDEAASLPLAGASALQAIEEHLDVLPGQKILIQGGSGGIGTLAIQLAKLKGAYVAVTANGSDKDLLTKLGADLVIDYKNQEFEKIIRDYDCVFDTVGGSVTNRSLSVIKRGGKLVTMIGQIDEMMSAKYKVSAIRQMTGVTSERLAKLKEYVETGKLKPIIDRVFPFEQTRAAYSYFVNEHPKGKVVVEIS